MRKILIVGIALVIISIMSVACGISQAEYDAVYSELDIVIEERDTAIKEKETAEVEIEKLANSVSTLENELVTLQKMVESLNSTSNEETTKQNASYAKSGLFSNYGFKFSYPINYSIDEMGMFGHVPNDDSGIVRAKLIKGQDMFQVIWININPALSAYMPNSNDLLNSAFILMTRIGLKNVIKSNVLKTNFAGYIMSYQTYSSTVLNQECSGVASVFYSDVESRFYQFITLRIGNYTTQDDIDYFHAFTNSFVGH